MSFYNFLAASWFWRSQGEEGLASEVISAVTAIKWDSNYPKSSRDEKSYLTDRSGPFRVNSKKLFQLLLIFS